MSHEVKPEDRHPSHSPRVLVAQLSQLIQQAEDAERFKKLSQRLLDQNILMQKKLNMLTNLVGEHIVEHGPLRVKVRTQRDDDAFFEVGVQASDTLGEVFVVAKKL